ncbi:hypothetical protein [Aureimonas frigidaquae]|uniref:Uncharacterized protein n=1 Tax=Aureimonas frigidaquae TaxID=424757 RepID=A0A0P0Z291_9HYPH|nr:hypothetical protein [Aureimonas frigidaquae]BAT28088.1 hypothetical protein [Aureimonas frigidaquae]
MKIRLALLVAAGLALSPSIATADCHDKSAEGANTISKDGTVAPLQDAEGEAQTGGAAEGTTTNMETAEQGAIAKDGSTMPMAASPGGGDAQKATSPQDVAAQQEGGDTAMASADKACAN